MTRFPDSCRVARDGRPGMDQRGEALNVGQAKQVARDWVRHEAPAIAGFQGAFVHGSVNWLPDAAVLPVTSDLDIMVLLDVTETPAKLGKFMYRGVLLEVSNLAADELSSAEQVLAAYQLAPSFQRATILADPAGFLGSLQREVARQFAWRYWVERRCDAACANVLRHLDGLATAITFSWQATAWLFGTGVTCHVLLAAGLRNPTVRRRYLDVRELLREYGRMDEYATLLDLLGCTDMSQERAAHHLRQLAGAFDAASAAITSPFFFATDLSPAARSVAIDGSQEMIAAADQREAMFWLTATYARCMFVFERDAPALDERYRPGFLELLADLGIADVADLRRRSEQVKSLLPHIRALADEIMDATPEITR